MKALFPTTTRGVVFAIRLFGSVLVLAILFGALTVTTALRSKDLEDWRRNLRGMSYLLAEHTSQTVFAARVVLDALADRVNQVGIRDEADFRKRLSTLEFHHLLKDKIQGSPQLDVASLVASNGDNINFSRHFPVTGINLAERDYFKAHLADPKLGVHISTSVRNKGNGQWTFYLSRRIENAEGRFMGLVLVGLSVKSITGIYDQVVQSLGEGSAISLFRTDRTALARSPQKDEVIGRQASASGPAASFLAQVGSTEQVVIADSERFSTGVPELRINALRRVDRYPLVLALIVPERIFLADWRRTAWMIGFLSLLSIGFVSGGILILTRSLIRREKTELELRESETKFHTMVDWAIDWEYWVREDHGIHYMTPSVVRMTGYEVDEFVRDPGLIARVIHPDDRAMWSAHVAEVEHEREAQRHVLDLRILHRNGTQLWVNHVCRPVYGPVGEYLGRRVTMRDITERKASEDEIRQLAYYDPLTALPNRRLFLERLRLALASSGAGFGALMMIDLDHFKKLNDTQGHDSGDELLREVAHRLLTSVDNVDTVARLGGDEFAVIVNALAPERSVAASQAEAVAGALRGVLNQPFSIHVGQPDYLSSPSIGVTLFKGSETPIEILMKQADVALYQAKDDGRNLIRFFNPQMQAAIDARIALEHDLIRAWQAKEFCIFYQQQVDELGRVIGVEALLRWQHPHLGLLMPDTFVPVAEDMGLIIELGQWVLVTACEQIRRWQDQTCTSGLRVAVNVSARQFHQPDFVEQVHRILDLSGADPRLLKLELTESIVIDRVDEVVQRMVELAEHGVGFSLDDFGTGYSSLSYLKRLPLDEIKIDRSFVRDLVEDSNDAAIVLAILAMSRSLGLKVVAEGVENQAQRTFLRDHGCQDYQGYLFGMPVPIEVLDEQLCAAGSRVSQTS
jgi:diguanylate cyclase (GGDEF)-like protein/PAS domain S-box-containing protein